MASQNLIEMSKHPIDSLASYGKHMIMWHDASVHISTSTGIEVFTLSCNNYNLNKNVDTAFSLLKMPTDYPTQNIIPQNAIHKNLDNEILVNIFVDPVLYPAKSKCSASIPIEIRKIEFSPQDLICNNKSILAVLSNVGGVYFYVKCRTNWILLLNLADSIVEYKKKSWDKKLDVQTDYDQLRLRCFSIHTTAICWGKLMSTNNLRSCLFITTQRDYGILIWNVNSYFVNNEDNLNVSLMYKLQSDIGEIDNLHVIINTANLFELVYSGVSGQVNCVKIPMENCIFKSSETSRKILWKYRDKMIVNYLRTFSISDTIILFFVKDKFLIFMALDDESNVLSTSKTDIGFKITSTYQTRNKDLIVTCWNGTIVRLNIKYDNNEIRISKQEYFHKVDLEYFGLAAMCCSENEALWVLLLKRSRVYERKYKFNLYMVYTHVKNYNYIERLYQNPSKKLGDLVDCLELCRYYSNHLKSAIIENLFSKFTLTNMQNYDYKLYLLFLSICKPFISSDKQDIDGKVIDLLNSVSETKAKETIVANHVSEVIVDIFRNKFSKTDSVIERLSHMYSYLKSFTEKYGYELKTYIDTNNSTFIDNLGTLDKVKCDFCEEDIVGLSCKHNHGPLFCFNSFQPLQDNYLVCDLCGSTASLGLYVTKPTCVLCDSYLNKDFASFDIKFKIDIKSLG